MNKLIKIMAALAVMALMSGLVACSCNKAEETEAAVTLPIDYFDEYTEEDRLKAIQDDIDAIDELQKDGVDTEEEKVAYELAVEDLLEWGPEYKEIVDEGRSDYNIDTDKLQEKHDEQVVENESASSEASSIVESLSEEIESATDAEGNITLPYGESEIELPTVRIK